MNDLDLFVEKIRVTPEETEFKDVIEVINAWYNYSPAFFSNGAEEDGIVNAAGENEGSCKIFSFALLHQLDETQTLNCFGQYYRHDVLEHQDGSDHLNIRNFIKHGWKNIKFEKQALELKAQ